MKGKNDILYLLWKNKKMNYNIILLIGLTLIIGGFLLFLYSEIKKRDLERQEAENQRFIDAILRTQQLQNIRKDIRKWQINKKIRLR